MPNPKLLKLSSKLRQVIISPAAFDPVIFLSRRDRWFGWEISPNQTAVQPLWKTTKNV